MNELLDTKITSFSFKKIKKLGHEVPYGIFSYLMESPKDAIKKIENLKIYDFIDETWIENDKKTNKTITKISKTLPCKICAGGYYYFLIEKESKSKNEKENGTYLEYKKFDLENLVKNSFEDSITFVASLTPENKNKVNQQILEQLKENKLLKPTNLYFLSKRRNLDLNRYKYEKIEIPLENL